jgi:Flp pilus assembly protein TadG
MSGRIRTANTHAAGGLIGQLLRDRAGNTLAMIAAGLFPLLALVGGGIDMGRSYLSQSRLQQACDAGVLAARKKLGSQVVLTGTVPADAQTSGEKFFNQNFRSGSYATKNRTFAMTLEADYAISGVAHVDVPTSIMYLFGHTNVAIDVKCAAKLNFSNTDIMFVLDTTGSMQELTSDDIPRIDVLKKVVKDFHTQIEGSKAPGTRVRYGFLPYSANVRVADILKSDWMVDKWTYQSRRPNTPTETTYARYIVTYTKLGGTRDDTTYPKSSVCPSDTKVSDYGDTVEVSASPHEYYYESLTNGIDYNCTLADGLYTITGVVYTDYKERAYYKYDADAPYFNYTYKYQPVEVDVSSLKGATGQDAPIYGSVQAEIEGNNYSSAPNPYDIYNTGCVEERDTYEITDWANVDLTRALDLDIDLVPTPGQPKTQWRPMLPEMIFERTIDGGGDGSFSVPAVDSSNYYLNPAWAGYASCPAAARKMGEMTATDVQSYLDTLVPVGATYHDIGMIWGGRIVSPTGLFASENADMPGKPTSRHMIFLTDGETSTFDIGYGTYGVDGLDRRRWRSQAESGISLDEVVEKRFGVACDEVKKRNITVWVIGFGTSLRS